MRITVLAITFFLMFYATVLARRHEEMIVFASYEDSDAEIFLMEGRDGRPIQLTDNDVYDGQPALSPDGELIAFVSRSPRGSEIYLMETRTANLKQLTQETGFAHPDWSPDARHIVCIHQNDIYTIDTKGVGLIRLTRLGNVSHVQWAPKGKSIVFAYGTAGGERIAILDASSGQFTELDTPKSTSYLPTWSPDGHQLAFAASAPSLLFHIYVMDEDGENVKRLTDSPGMDFEPVWSPDGTRIAFVRMMDDQTDIHVMDADGSNVRNLTNSPEAEAQPSWSPDGRKLAFASAEKMLPTLFVINADGKGRRKLIEGSGGYAFPNWLPDGRISFLSYEDGSIYAIDENGGDFELLIDNRWRRGMVILPVWSPDGKRIAYQLVPPAGSPRGIYVSDSDGRNERLVADLASIKGRYSWSPDGKKLAISFRGDQIRALVHVVDAASGETFCLGDGDAFVQQATPSFSPDGRKIAFSGQEDVDHSNWVNVMKADGSDPRLVGPTKLLGRVTGMTWSPDSSVILFSGPGPDRNIMRSIYQMDIQTGQVEKWHENAETPDWIKPRSLFSVNPQEKLLTFWGKVKLVPMEH